MSDILEGQKVVPEPAVGQGRAEEERLEARIAGGEDDAIWELYSLIRPILLSKSGAAFSLARETWLDEEDVMQELYIMTHLQAIEWRKMPPGNRPPLAPLLVKWAPIRLLTRLQVMTHRRPGQPRREESTPHEDFSSGEWGDRGADRHDTWDEEAHLDYMSLRDALGELPPLRRAIVELQFLGGWTLECIASALRLHPNTVRLYHRETLDFLKERLEGKETTAPPDPPPPVQKYVYGLSNPHFVDDLMTMLGIASRRPDGKLPSTKECQEAGLPRRFAGRARPLLERLGIISPAASNRPAYLAVPLPQAITRLKEAGKF